MTDETKLKVLDFTKETDADKLDGIIAQVKRDWPQRLRVFEMIAKERVGQYQAYKREGFTAEEALRLVIAEIQK